jgi:Na+/H+-dicarboxylate symporter
MKIKSILGHLYVQVLIGVALGVVVGALWPDLGASLKPIGDGFVKLVKFMIAPIVFCTIVGGITSLRDTRKVGPTLIRSLGLFYALTALALALGLAAVTLFQPGAGMHIDPTHRLFSGPEVHHAAPQQQPGGLHPEHHPHHFRWRLRRR